LYEAQSGAEGTIWQVNSPCKGISPLITRIVPNGRYGGTLGTWTVRN